MIARLERKLRMLAVIGVAGVVAGLVFVSGQGRTSWPTLAAAVAYGLLISLSIGGLELFVADGVLRRWLERLPFTASVVARSVVYAGVIVLIQVSQLGSRLVGLPFDPSEQGVWHAIAYSGLFAIGMNLAIGIANLIGPRAFLNFVTGRYHVPVEESRFVLFVDIAGSTGLAERLGGIGFHRFLDQAFKLLTQPVVDFRGEVLGYVGDEIIVTWSEAAGGVDCRPLRCFAAMRAALARSAGEFERAFGAAPRIRGSLHFGPVIIGEIGNVKRAIVFNGDVMNTAARLEELSRQVDGGFLVSRTALQCFNATPPFAMRDLGLLPIRGRADGIAVVGLDMPG
ncbi:adenylate/guanylate cyclase domain-containing protein [Bradyrhizobium sp. 2TAF24]|uniref:adenylate/guanylate cyclase domain-containing protein n=1 Tax=Bradyrhizobium sp. 2TAF24 TaxID=3233011 RepID=UPI003F92D24F